MSCSILTSQMSDAAQVGHQILRKRIHVRIEHVAPSRCREEFLVRQKKNDQIKHEAKERGGALQLLLYHPCLHHRRHDA